MWKQIDVTYINELELINASIVIENHGGDSTADDHSNLTDEELRNLCKLALGLTAPPDKVEINSPIAARIY